MIRARGRARTWVDGGYGAAAWRLAVCLMGMLELGSAVNAADGLPRRGPHGLLAQVRTWDYVINKANPARIAGVNSDLVVMDYSRWGDDFTRFSPRVIAGLKRRPDGGRRLVLAYLSVGEAEAYRYYWRWSWHLKPPPFVLAENCRWPGNHPVRYWDATWQDILFKGQHSYLERIQAQGFDGVYLDRVDAFGEFEGTARPREPKARSRMVALVGALAAQARARDADFLIIAQNGEELLSDRTYRRTLDGVAKEDLLFGLSGSGVPNDKGTINFSVRALNLLKSDGKPVLTVEYLARTEQMAAAALRLRQLGYTPVFPSRQLDGSDPTVATATDSKPKAGTPEWAKTACK